MYVSKERLVTQAEYARLKGITPARANQMIKEKKVISVYDDGVKKILLSNSEISRKK